MQVNLSSKDYVYRGDNYKIFFSSKLEYQLKDMNGKVDITTTNEAYNIDIKENDEEEVKENTEEEVSENGNDYAEAEVKEGIVSKDQLDNIKGKNKNLKMIGTLGDGREYVFTINGMDIETSDDINIEVTYRSEFEDEVKLLAEHPFFLHFSQEGEFPAEIQVEI